MLVLPMTPLVAARYHPSVSMSLIISPTFNGTNHSPAVSSRPRWCHDPVPPTLSLIGADHGDCGVAALLTMNVGQRHPEQR
jgi:hypothetical protein